MAYIDGVAYYVECDPDDPPRVESEAAYLERRGLLTAGEKRRLKPEGLRAGNARTIRGRHGLLFEEYEDDWI